ncbi:MAG TPA: hypothetical protein VL475_11815, partial [Planctomycetaceae bacterium]|nr:hypothetical protein [Planctomycetaceae bacterium]
MGVSSLQNSAAVEAPHDPAVPSGRLRFAIVGAAIFLALGLVRIGQHEPWRDEGEVWTMAHDSGSFGALTNHLRYNGHPYLWPVLAW